MAACWLLKTEPSTYSWQDLVREKRTVWDGITNAAALIAILQMKQVKGAYQDPKRDDPKLAVVDVAPVKALAQPVALADIKSRKDLADFPLVRISRLSTMPVTADHRKVLRELGVA